jgi:hypothetical protein
MKSVKLSALVYEMLLTLSKKARKRPEDFLEDTIKELYQRKK